MNRLFKLLLAAAVGLFFVGCYNDYDAPGPAKIYTQADLEEMGLQHISIKDLKARFKADNPDDGPAASWTVTEPLYTYGKVISSDRYGNVYKSVYLYDAESESAIELKLNTGNYIFHPVGQIVYVKLQGLVLGNYRGMTSIGRYSSNADYANDNIESPIMKREHIFTGEQQQMLQSDTLVVTKENYKQKLTEDDEALGRLVRFEGVESKFGQAPWGYKNTFPNYFANSASFDVNSPDDGNKPKWSDIPKWATWALKRPLANANTYFYGSAWFTYDATAQGNPTTGAAAPGNYVVRTSGYSQFRENKIPEDGRVVDLTAIYTKFTGGSGQNATYQLTLISDRDVILK